LSFQPLIELGSRGYWDFCWPLTPWLPAPQQSVSAGVTKDRSNVRLSSPRYICWPCCLEVLTPAFHRKHRRNQQQQKQKSERKRDVISQVRTFYLHVCQ